MKTQKTANYSEHEVLYSLKRKHDIRVQGSTIIILYGSSAKGDVGIKTKGKIDFLTRYCGYNKFFTHKFD